jgi:hypothetical protein
MMLSLVLMAVMVTVTAIGSAFGLKRSHYLRKIRSEAAEHIFDHMVGPEAENLVSNFSRQMPISKMPGKAHKLIGIFMPCLDDKLRSGLNLKPSPILELKAISFGHGNRFRQVEKDIFTLIGGETNAATMARVKVESESTSRLFFGPVPGGAMNRSRVDGHIST